MPLKPVITFSQEEVHISPALPLCLRHEYYPARRDVTTPPVITPPPEAGLTRWRRDFDQVLPHGHDFYEVAMVVGGEAEHITEAGVETLRRGTVVVVPRGQVHGYEAYRDCDMVNVFYIAEWLAEDLADVWRHQPLVRLFLDAALFDTPVGLQVHVFQLSETRLAACLHEVYDIAAQLRRSEPNLLFLRACLVKLLVLLHEAWEEGSPSVGGHFRREVWSVLEEVERRIGLGLPIDVAATARACGMSPEHLTREFRRATGMSIMRYFQQRRLQRATRMLLDPDTTITEVAHALGFSDYAHFRRRFVDYYGISPGDYRRANRAPAAKNHGEGSPGSVS